MKGRDELDRKLFRKSSIDKVSSPEQLNEYIKVASPGVWIVLSAMLILLSGLLVWSIFGTIDSYAPGVIVQKDGTAVCYVKSDRTGTLHAGMRVQAEESDGEIKAVSVVPVKLDETTDPYLLYIGGFQNGDFCYIAELEIEGMADGIYPAKITTDSVRPISFIVQ